MKRVIDRIERARKSFSVMPLIVKQQLQINTLDNQIEVLTTEKKELQNIIKSDLYKDFMDKLEAPHKIAELKETLKLRTQQRNTVRDENLKLREELKKGKESTKDYDLIIKQRDRYKKQVKSLKEIIKEAK